MVAGRPGSAGGSVVHAGRRATRSRECGTRVTRPRDRACDRAWCQGESTDAGDAAEGAEAADTGLSNETTWGAGLAARAVARGAVAGALWTDAGDAALGALAGEATDGADATDWLSSGEPSESAAGGAIVVVVVIVGRACLAATRSSRRIRSTGASSPPLFRATPRMPPTPSPASAAVAPTTFHFGVWGSFIFTTPPPS